GKNSGQCSLIEAMSPMPVPTSSQTVAHTTYSNSTRTVAASTDGVATRPGSRIRVRIADNPIVIAPHSCRQAARISFACTRHSPASSDPDDDGDYKSTASERPAERWYKHGTTVTAVGKCLSRALWTHRPKATERAPACRSSVSFPSRNRATEAQAPLPQAGH